MSGDQNDSSPEKVLLDETGKFPGESSTVEFLVRAATCTTANANKTTLLFSNEEQSRRKR